MKPSVMYTFGVVLFMVFALSSAAITAEAVSPEADTKQATKKLPGSIKIRPLHLKVKAVVTPHQHANKLRAKLKEVQDMAEIINNQASQLEQKVTAMVNKREECLNKTFTTADMTAAGCVAQNTLAECEEKLYFWCFHDEWFAARGQSSVIDMHSMPPFLGASHSAGDIFREWKEHIETGIN